MDRLDRAITAGLGAATVLVLTGLPAHASSSINWGPDDWCAAQSSYPFFYATGPLAFWHVAAYTGGPSGNGGVCMMYTQNVQEYINYADDNTSYWYLPVSPSASGLYGVWAFVPAVYATTNRATYEYWEYGHLPGSKHPFGLCAVNQLSLYNTYARLCAATQGHTNQFYFCSDSASNCGGFFRLVDATGETSLSTYVGSDEMDYCFQATSDRCSTMTAGLPLDYSSPVLPDTLTANQTLSAGQYLTSNNAAYNLIMQSTGNLVILGPSGTLWTKTSHANAYALMQADGNFVIYGQGGSPAYWATNTQGNPGAHLVIQCDGNLVIYRTNGTAAWSSGTQQGSCTFE